MIDILRDDCQINSTNRTAIERTMSQESTVFNELRPLCVDLSRLSFQPQQTFDPQSGSLRDALKGLERKLASYTDEVSIKLADYIFVPISSLLKQNSLGKAQTDYVLLIIAHLLRLAWRSNGTLEKALARQLLPLITFLINPDKNDELRVETSQEDRIAGCSALFEFFQSLNQQSYCGEFFSANDPKALGSLGHSISILLSILEESSQDVDTQLKSIQSLQILYQKIVCDGEMLSFVLPGNISSFCKVLTLPGMTTNYKVASKILEVMNDLLLLIYDDRNLNTSLSKLTDLKQLDSIADENGKSSLGLVEVHGSSEARSAKHRSTSWLRATSSQVRLALEKIIPKLFSRNNSEISAALVTLASAILDRCCHSLGNCEDLLIKILVEARTDPRFQLASHTNCLRNIVSGEFHKLDKTIKFENVDALKSLEFALLSLQDLASESDMLPIGSICTTLIETFEAEIRDSALKKRENGILEQSSQVALSDSFDKEAVRAHETPAILASMSKRVEVSLGHVLATLGSTARKNGQLTVLVNALLSSQICENSVRKTVALWVTSWLVSGLGETTSASELEFLDIDTYATCDKEVCYDILEFSGDLAQEIIISTEGKRLSASSEKSLIIVLQSIELMCNILGEDFASELMDYLYIVVENLGSPSPKVRHIAQSCALTISHVLYGDSLQLLILRNVDYLADSIASRLNSGMTERVSTVFMVICKIAGYETIASFKDIIETIFKLLDYYHGYDSMCLQFFQLFEVIVLEIKKEYLSGPEDCLRLMHQDKPIESNVSWGLTDLTQVISFMDKNGASDDEIETSEAADKPKNFQEYFDSKLRELDSDDEDEHEGLEEEEHPEKPEPEEDQAQGDQWVSPMPRSSYKILLQILAYGDRLLTHRSKPLRVQILRTMELMIPMLATQHDSLLPQVAQVWNTLALCSLDDDFSIVKPACDCLKEVILSAGDFVTTRFLDLWKSWKDNSGLLRELKVGSQDRPNHFTSLTTHQKFPTLTQLALTSLSYVLLDGIAVAGLMLPDSTAREMVTCCLQILPSESISSKSLLLGDMVYAIAHEA